MGNREFMAYLRRKSRPDPIVLSRCQWQGKSDDMTKTEKKDNNKVEKADAGRMGFQRHDSHGETIGSWRWI